MKRVAIIDGNHDHRLIARALLEGRYRCSAYETGRDALAGMRVRRPDVILLDVSLSEQDGVEVLLHIRQDSQLKHVPVVAVTSHATTSGREKFLKAGFDECFAKPVLDESLLFEVVDRALSATSA